MMTKSSDFAERAGERLGPPDFVDPAYRAIFEALLADPELRASPPGMDPVAAQRLEEILDDPEVMDHGGRMFEDAVARIRAATLARRIVEVDRRIEQATEESEKRALTEEKARLSKERRAVAPDDWTTAIRRRRIDPNSNQQDR